MTEPVEKELFIDGSARPVSDSGTYDIYNPARPLNWSGAPLRVRQRM